MNRFVSLLLFLSSLLIAQRFAEARYRLEARVYSFSNPRNQDFDGGDCDVGGSTCDVYFTFCARTINTSPTNDFLCNYGGFRTTIARPITSSGTTFDIGQNIGGSSVPNPVPFTGTFAWPGSFQLLITLNDADSPDSDDLIDRVAPNVNLLPSEHFTTITRYSGFYGRASMELSFRVKCQTNYYGPRCDQLCIPRDDAEGHYTCDDDGNIVCLSGYTGTTSFCVTPICADGCVQGDCNAPGECNCFSGWMGDLCDQCIPATGCVNGLCNQPGECECLEGYSGTLCNIDNDVCGHQQPCQNGGTCSNNGPGDYTCSCPPGYTGADCELDVDECIDTPCENGATCMNTMGSFTCTCAVGWTGDTCGDNIDECSSSTPPCQNGGNCTDCIPTGPGSISDPSNSVQQPCLIGYMCTCPEGFFGDNCETEEDFCMPSPCANGSTCHDIIGGPGFECICAVGFTGELCDMEIDECMDNPCQNGGTCTDNVGFYTCECPTGFTGTDCNINIDDCDPFPCTISNTHECMDGVNSYTCLCVPGYTGQNCDEEIDECASMPCSNGATCTDLFNDFECECPTGFEGALCEINIDDCHPSVCLNGGTCVDGVNDFTCTCIPKYTGAQCETPSPTCDDKPCGEDEFCVPLVDGTFTCEPCVDGEAGCGKPIVGPDTQIGNNNTSSDTGKRDSLIGGIVGGAIFAAIALLILIAVIICCCVKYCGCCPCCVITKEQETEMERRYQSWTDNGVQDNPLYFGTSTILSGTSHSGTIRSSNTMPHYDADIDNKNNGPLQNPMYAIAQEHIQRSSLSSHPPNLPPRNGSISDSGSSTNSTTAPLLAPNPSDGHYEEITASKVPKAAPVLASGKYDRLKTEPTPEPESAVSGKYDKLTVPVQPATENPYIVEKKDEEKENPYTSVERQGGRHKDMYFALPSASELKGASNKSEKKEEVKESDFPPRKQNPYDFTS